MLDFLSPKEYVNFYILLVPLLTFLVVITSGELENRRGPLFFIWLISFLFMGFRPLSGGAFTDMLNYDGAYKALLVDHDARAMSNDSGFGWYAQICSYFLSSEMWFAFTAFIYTIGYVILYKSIAHDKAIYLYLLLYTSFFFFSYGTNTIRAGFGSSVLMVALTFFYKGRKSLSILFGLLAISIHHGLMLSFVAMLAAFYIPSSKDKLFYYGWVACLLGSILIGPTIQNVILPHISVDERLERYMTHTEDIGGVFRWDFAIYCALPVVWSWIVKSKYNYTDHFYSIITRTYLAANAGWLLLIRAAFTDRFAYMSWVLIPIVLGYPLLDNQCIYPLKRRMYNIFVLINICLIVYLHFK